MKGIQFVIELVGENLFFMADKDQWTKSKIEATNYPDRESAKLVAKSLREYQTEIVER